MDTESTTPPSDNQGTGTELDPTYPDRAGNRRVTTESGVSSGRREPDYEITDHSRGESQPVHPIETFETRGEWIRANADLLGVEAEQVRKLVHEMDRQCEAQEILHIFGLALTHFLDRPNKAEVSRVEVKLSTSELSDIGYRILDNRHERGGAHYITELPRSKTERIRTVAIENGYEVLGHGDSYISVSVGSRAVERDVQLLEQVLTDVFQLSPTDIADITEVFDENHSRSWLTLDL